MLIATVTAWLPIAETPAAAPVAALELDHALARQAAAGDSTAFEALYRRHAGRVHGVVSRIVGGDRARAEDLTQETFVRAWQALPAYRYDSAFGTWLHRLAVNTALMDLRSRRSRPQFGDDEEALERAGSQDSAGHSTALALDLERAVATLPPRARAVLVLFDVEGSGYGFRVIKSVSAAAAEMPTRCQMQRP